MIVNPDNVWICSCCGEPCSSRFPSRDLGEKIIAGRCEKHRSSNPCAAPGCKRTIKAKYGLSESQMLCRDHFREVCPPHSRIRRSYRRFWRISKKMGLKAGDRWPEPLESRFWRFWHGLVKRSRAQKLEPMDVDVINKMFGWDQ